MKFLRTALWYSFLAIMCPIWLALFCGILFLFLISLAWETWDMSRMREQAVSSIVSVEVEQGHRGSRPIITYTYTVAGAAHSSSRYTSGFLGNSGMWSGGGAAARDFAPGQQVRIHYAADDPDHACLEYGWHKWSVGEPLFVYGLGLPAYVASRLHSSRRLWRQIVQALHFAVPAYGFLLMGFGPNVVRPHELHWHSLSFVALFLVALAYCVLRGFRATTDQNV